jgi:hypothetical protein
MVGSPTRTNSLPHRIDRDQFAPVRSKTEHVKAVRLTIFNVFCFIPFAFLTRILAFHQG